MPGPWDRFLFIRKEKKKKTKKTHSNNDFTSALSIWCSFSTDGLGRAKASSPHFDGLSTYGPSLSLQNRSGGEEGATHL